MWPLKWITICAFSSVAVVAGYLCRDLRNGYSADPQGRTEAYIKGIYSLPLTLDPSQMDDTSSLLVSNLIYDGLLQFNADLELRGAIAESWTTSKNGKLITFQLRKTAKFHDGTPVTQAAIIQSFERVIGPGSKVYSYYDCIEGAEAFHRHKRHLIAGLNAVGGDKIEFRLLYPFPPFLSVLAGATAKILPLSSSQAHFFDHPIGSGPFQYRGVKTNAGQAELLLSRFENYAGEKAKISELVLRVMDEAQALSQAKIGKVHDLASFPLSGKEDAFKQGQDITAPVAATWIIGLNLRIPPFNNIKVRRAFRDSIDVEQFRKIFSPDAVSSNGYIPPGLPGYHRSYQASVKPIRVVKAPTHSLIRIAIPKLLARSEEMKEYFENSLRKQGWNIEAVPMEWGDLMQAYSSKSLQSFLVSMNMDYPDTEFLIRNFESLNPDNFSGLKSPLIDKMIHKARATQDRIERDTIYSELVTLLNQEAVTVNLFHPRGHFWVHSCVDGFEPNLLADVYIDYRTVSLNRECQSNRVQKVGA